MKLHLIFVLLIVAQISARVHRSKRARRGNPNFSQNKNSFTLLGKFFDYSSKFPTAQFKKDMVTEFVDKTVGTSVNSFQSMSDEFCKYQNDVMKDAISWRWKSSTRKRKFRASPSPEDKEKSDCLADVITSNADIVKKLGEASSSFQAKIANVKNDAFPALLDTYKSDIAKIDPNLTVTNKITVCIEPKTCKVR